MAGLTLLRAGLQGLLKLKRSNDAFKKARKAQKSVRAKKANLSDKALDPKTPQDKVQGIVDKRKRLNPKDIETTKEARSLKFSRQLDKEELGDRIKAVANREKSSTLKVKKDLKKEFQRIFKPKKRSKR